MTGDCIENNEAVDETEKEINVADIHIGPGEVSQIINVLKEYQDKLVDDSKTVESILEAVAIFTK